MQIAAQKVVHIHYTLTNDEGEVLDTSSGRGPLAFIHGAGNIIPGLENALTGCSAGDKLQVAISPEDAYGLRDDSLVHMVPMSAFEGAGQIEPGMQVQAQSPEGIQIFTVMDVTGEGVVLDGNHPMAGVPLNFDVEIAAVRDATQEELSHGHVHGPGGHHHG